MSDRFLKIGIYIQAMNAAIAVMEPDGPRVIKVNGDVSSESEL